MAHYYENESAYHRAVSEIAEERPSAEERPLLEAIRELSRRSDEAARAPKTGAVLDIGCGTCGSAEALLEATGASTFYGVDASPFAIAEAQREHPSYRLSVGDAAALKFPDGSFDAVLSTYVLEHMVYPERVLDEAVRVTRAGGLIAWIVPVRDLPWMTPASLRHRARSPAFVARFTAERWTEAIRLRFDPAYFAFRSVDDPIALRNEHGYSFQQDDDLVYVGSSREIQKYLETKGCSIAWRSSRDISSFVANGRRPLVDLARRAVFFGFRLSLGALDAADYTTTVSLIARKSG